MTSILSVIVGSPVVVVVGGMAVPTDDLTCSVLCVVVACFGLVDTGGWVTFQEEKVTLQPNTGLIEFRRRRTFPFRKQSMPFKRHLGLVYMEKSCPW